MEYPNWFQKKIVDATEGDPTVVRMILIDDPALGELLRQLAEEKPEFNLLYSIWERINFTKLKKDCSAVDNLTKLGDFCAGGVQLKNCESVTGLGK